MRKNKKGFTLVELLAVLAILVTILLVAIPSVTSSLSRTEENELESKKQIIISAIELNISEKDCFFTPLKNSQCYLSISSLLKDNWITEDEIRSSSGTILNGNIYYDNTTFKYKYINDTNGLIECYEYDSCI